MLKEIIERVASLKKLHPLTTTGMEKLYVQDMDTALSLISRMRGCLERIEKWDFDIMVDCVADAQKLAGETLKETE